MKAKCIYGNEDCRMCPAETEHDACRKAFEAWADPNFRLERDPFDRSDYRFHYTETAWRSWKDCWAYRDELAMKPKAREK